MRYCASEKFEIIELVQQSSLSICGIMAATIMQPRGSLGSR